MHKRRLGGPAAAGAVVVAWCAATHAAEVAFTDVTLAAGLNVAHQPSALMQAGANIIASLCSGGVVGDFDNDGFQDIFVVVGGAAPDVLYMNNGDGTFTNQAAEWGVAVKHMGMAAAAADYDGDGWLDIFVTSGGPDGAPPLAGKHRLYRNTGKHAFEEVAAAAGVAAASPILCDGLGATFGDYDLDGDLDLFVSSWLYPSNGNRLFRNNGDGTFTDATLAAGLSLFGVRGFSPRFVDMDGDRYPELLFAADFGTSRYLANNRDGTFTDRTAASGTGLDDNGMGHVVADLDGDGQLDWFVTSVWAQGFPEVPGTGNTLYRAVGAHEYDEVAADSGVVNGNWGWGATAADLDHDGDLDLVQTNGWPYHPQFVNQPTRVWINDGAGVFTDVAATCGLWHTLQGRGLLSFDYDNDGDRDILVFAYKDKMRLYRNDGASASWLRLDLDTSGAARCAPAGIGTHVRAVVGGVTLHRHLDAGTNYQTQDELAIHLGLGGASVIDELRIEWADGTATLLRDVPGNRRLTVHSGERCDLDGDGAVGPADLGVLLAAWGAIDAADPRDLDADGEVGPSDLAVLLLNWSTLSPG